MTGPSQASVVRNALTIDVEEWHDTCLFSQDNPKKPLLRSRLPSNIDDILSFLDQHHVKATFFILGSVAERYPDTIRAISLEGHEIACHGYRHDFVYTLTQQQFEQDVTRALDILRKITGRPVLGYRAPTWSMTMRQYPWAFEILQRLGFRYDSSLYPLGVSGGDPRRRVPFKILPDLVEFPPSTFNFLGSNIPFAGGTFLRFLPLNLVIKKIESLNKAHYPAMIYFHSWEFDLKPPEDNSLTPWKRCIMYHGMDALRSKIAQILQRFNFAPINACMDLFR